MNPKLVNLLVVLTALAVGIGSQYAGGLAAEFQTAAAFLLGLGTKRYGDRLPATPDSELGDGY